MFLQTQPGTRPQPTRPVSSILLGGVVVAGMIGATATVPSTPAPSSALHLTAQDQPLTPSGRLTAGTDGGFGGGGAAGDSSGGSNTRGADGARHHWGSSNASSSGMSHIRRSDAPSGQLLEQTNGQKVQPGATSGGGSSAAKTGNSGQGGGLLSSIFDFVKSLLGVVGGSPSSSGSGSGSGSGASHAAQMTPPRDSGAAGAKPDKSSKSSMSAKSDNHDSTVPPGAAGALPDDKHRSAAPGSGTNQSKRQQRETSGILRDLSRAGHYLHEAWIKLSKI